jgi:diguanylate cyclase
VAKLSGQLQTLAGETLRLRDDIQQERLRALSDPLTGLSNRLGLEERLAYEVAMWQRESYPLAVIIFDIDHFKSINDQFGHQAGDRVLKTIADQLRSQTRRTDFLARYGGEEFIMLLPRTKLADACQLADKLRHHIESCKFIYRDVQVPVTLSCGVAEFHQGDETEAVLDRADQALYIAKNEGRNRCFTEQDLSCPATPPSAESAAPASALAAQ